MTTNTNVDFTQPDADRTSTYTDADCTGAPVVPDLRDDADSRESLAETVWSHRITEPTDE